jgi:hypothetical protein
LEQDVRDFLLVRNQTLGDIEVQIDQQSRELPRKGPCLATTKPSSGSGCGSHPWCHAIAQNDGDS